MKNPDIWFPAKRYGYGWGPPRCWQGWLVLGGFCASLGAGALIFPPHRHPAYYILYVLALVAALTFVCWLKGEKPRWRWGGEE